jgi:DeoR/GlpR family transcriptional regulator of sugar metabolism
MTTRQEIAKLLKANGPMSLAELGRKLMHIGPHTIRAEVLRGVHKGEFVRAGHGVYRLATPADEKPQAPDIRVRIVTTSSEFDGPGVDIDAAHKRGAKGLAA